MIFKRETDYNSLSAEGYRISLARLGDGRVAYTAWYQGKPLGECQTALASDPKHREAAFASCKEQCEADHVARGGTVNRPNR